MVQPLLKRWRVLGADDTLVDFLHSELNISKVICRLLVQRGIDNYNKAKKYFRPQLTDLHDPWRMKNMLKAVKRIQQALETKEKILVYGDYDVDGTTSVACMYQFLGKIHDPQLLDFYIPHRYKEGYGISKAGIDFAIQNNFNLVISLDCGIKSAELIQYALDHKIEFIVCDHHLPDEVIPPAIAILNPKQTDCEYPYKELCGCGVGFKLITALSEELKLPDEWKTQCLDLLATAIAADIVPMTGENRILCHYGLLKANESPNVGIKALKELSGMTGKVNINNLVFMIAPRVNAAGRMDDAKKAVSMFVAPIESTAREYAEMLHSDNFERKEADKLITEEALAAIEANPEWIGRKSTLVYQPNWHKGVVGIVASRLIDHYYRPTIVLTKSGDVVSGSARSVPGFNLYEAIHACREHLIGYGGHFAAAGMTLKAEEVDFFREKFEKVVASTIHPDQLIPEIIIDAEIKFREITQGLFGLLELMEPFGPENQRPVFIAYEVFDSGYSKIVKENHIKFSLKQDGVTYTGIGFNMASKFEWIKSGQPFDVVFSIEENEWNGNKNLQLKVIDLRCSLPKN